MRRFILLMLLVGCAVRQEEAGLPVVIEDPIPYNNSFCASTGYGEGNVSSGIRLVLKDREGNLLEGRGDIATRTGGGGLGESYTCTEGGSTEAIITAFSKGYAPVSFPLRMPEGQLATVVVTLFPSCEGQDFYENLRIRSSMMSDPQAYIESSTQRLDSILRDNGLEGNLSLDCIEADMGRGGYVRANGTASGEPFSLYYHWGWCSSGGTDCGMSICLRASDEVMEDAREKICQKLSETQHNDGHICTEEEYDRTEEVRSRCMEGAFDEDGAISIIQSSNRCNSSVSIGGC